MSDQDLLPRYGVALMSCPTRMVTKSTEQLWDWPGFQGFEELPDADAGFYVPSEDFEILEFGSEAAERCAEWLDSGDFQRRNAFVYLKIYFLLELPDGESFPADFRAWVEKNERRIPRGCELISWLELPNTDYLENYKKSVRGLNVGENMWVGPPWDSAPEGRSAFIVEPGMAFGTGDHPTTQMCLALIEELAKDRDFKPKLIYDVGTGSGILALAARRFFPEAEIVMTDLDPLCELEVKKTFALNNVTLDGTRLVCGPKADLKRLGDWKLGDLLLSNIYAEVLASLLPELAKLVKRGSPWVVSGLLEGPATEAFEADATEKLFTLEKREVATRERAILDAKHGLSREAESWGARLFVRR